MNNEYQGLRYAKQKIIQTNQYRIHTLYDNYGNKKYTLFYDRNNNLVKIEEYQKYYLLQINQNDIVLRAGDKQIKFTHQEVLTPQVIRNEIYQLKTKLQDLNSTQIYFGVTKQKLTDSEANETLMNYVHLSRDLPHPSNSLINIDQKLFKEDDLWLDLSENIEPINSLIKQYQSIEKNKQIITNFLNKLNDASLLEIQNLLPKDEDSIIENQNLSTDISWKLAGAAAELLVTDKLQKLSDSINFHNVVLPFDYGYGQKQNQIDNLLVNEKGIFCIEVKSKKISNGIYNFDKEEKYQYRHVRQVLNHAHAVKSYLLQNGLLIESKYIHPVILIMNRNSNGRDQNFKINNSLPLQVINFNELESLTANIDETLAPDKINQISNLLKLRDVAEPLYSHYNFLPKLAASSEAVKVFKDRLKNLDSSVSKLAEKLEEYNKVKKWQKVLKIIRLSPSFQYFNKEGIQ